MKVMQRHMVPVGRKCRNPGMVRLLASALQVDCSPLSVVLLLYKHKLSKNIYLISEELFYC